MVAYLVIPFVFIIIGPQASIQDKSSFEFCRYNHDKELITESRRMRRAANNGQQVAGHDDRPNIF